MSGAGFTLQGPLYLLYFRQTVCSSIFLTSHILASLLLFGFVPCHCATRKVGLVPQKLTLTFNRHGSQLFTRSCKCSAQRGASIARLRSSSQYPGQPERCLSRLCRYLLHAYCPRRRQHRNVLSSTILWTIPALSNLCFQGHDVTGDGSQRRSLLPDVP